jgi:hypothetical protein
VIAGVGETRLVLGCNQEPLLLFVSLLSYHLSPYTMTTFSDDPNRSSGDEQWVTLLRSTDVLLGRGSGSYDHEGNVMFRDLVRDRKSEYTDAKNRKTKNKIAREIVEAVLAKTGRFLKQIDPEEAKKLGIPNDVDAWCPVDEKTSTKKAMHALRKREGKGGADSPVHHYHPSPQATLVSVGAPPATILLKTLPHNAHDMLGPELDPKHLSEVTVHRNAGDSLEDDTLHNSLRVGYLPSSFHMVEADEVGTANNSRSNSNFDHESNNSLGTIDPLTLGASNDSISMSFISKGIPSSSTSHQGGSRQDTTICFSHDRANSGRRHGSRFSHGRDTSDRNSFNSEYSGVSDLSMALSQLDAIWGEGVHPTTCPFLSDDELGFPKIPQDLSFIKLPTYCTDGSRP